MRGLVVVVRVTGGCQREDLEHYRQGQPFLLYMSDLQEVVFKVFALVFAVVLVSLSVKIFAEIKQGSATISHGMVHGVRGLGIFPMQTPAFSPLLQH